jgi:hypothetical protein
MLTNRIKNDINPNRNMMKINFFVFLLFLMVGNVYSQNTFQFRNARYVDRNGNFFTFSEGRRLNGIKNGNPQNGLYNGSYHITEEDGINYLNILWDDNTRDKYLLLGSVEHGYFIYVYLYNENAFPFFCAGMTLSEWEPYNVYLRGQTEILSASTVLREGNTVYSTNNLDERIGVCWAARGGIGEKIIFKYEEETDYIVSFNSLYISIGFVSMEKPYLYRQNSRPKIIRISHEGEDPKIIQLVDTPNLQYIDCDWSSGFSWGYRKDLWIEILEIYPGTRYNDTCINFFQWRYIQ